MSLRTWTAEPDNHNGGNRRPRDVTRPKMRSMMTTRSRLTMALLRHRRSGPHGCFVAGHLLRPGSCRSGSWAGARTVRSPWREGGTRLRLRQVGPGGQPLPTAGKGRFGRPTKNDLGWPLGGGRPGRAASCFPRQLCWCFSRGGIVPVFSPPSGSSMVPAKPCCPGTRR
jgi:hypothetical protein